MSKSPKRAFHRRFLQKSSEKPHRSTHIKQSCQVSRFHNALPDSNPNVTATFTSNATRNLTIPCACHANLRVHASNRHKVLLLSRNMTATPRNLTIPCTCHENRTSTPQNPHKVVRLPQKVTISYHVSFNRICTARWGMISTRSEHIPIHLKSTVTKTQHRCNTLKRKSQCHSHIQHPINVTAQKTADLTKRYACAVNSSSLTLRIRH